MQKVYDIIVDQIIEKLENGIIPWRKSWKGGIPSNYVTGSEYRGINRLILTMNDYSTNYYLTYAQIKKMGGKVLAGHKSTKVLYWSTHDDEKEEGKKKFFTRYYHVFNLEQTNLIPINFLEEESEKLPGYRKAKQIICDYQDRPSIKLGEPCYDPEKDTVYIPRRNHFDSLDEYYSTIFHELVHSTGNSARLARDGVMQVSYFGSGTYSREELIAEIGSMFLCNSCNILTETLDNSVGYIQNWLKFLKENKREIITASNHAEKAAEYILKNSG